MCRELQVMDDKKEERPITIVFERNSIQVSENENPKPSDTIRNDSSDQACSTTKRSGSTTASIEPSSGNANSLNVDFQEKPHQPKLKQFPLKEMENKNDPLTQNSLISSSFYITGEKVIL